MAQTKISQLTELSTIADNDVLAGVDTSAGTTKKVKMSTLKSYINTGDAQDVQINGTSIVSGNVANIAVEGTYNASTNKIETVSDVNSKTGTLSNLTTTNKTNLVSAINELNTNKEENSNKTDTLDENSTNTQYPGAKAVYDLNETTKEGLENALAETQAQLDTYKTIFNALPKVSGTGENISLDGTAESPLKMDLKGNTSQNTLTGKNISNVAYVSDKGITYNGNDINIVNPTNYLYAGDNWNLRNDSSRSGKTYTVYSIANGTSSDREIALLIAKTGDSYAFQHKIPINTTWKDNVKVQTITLGENEVFTSMSIYISGSTTANLNYKVMIVEGSYTTETIGDYEPYCGNIPSPNPSYPQTIQVVSGDNSVVVCGKNLFSGIAYSEKHYMGDDGTIYSGNSHYNIYKINAIPSTTYVFTYVNGENSRYGRVLCFDKNDNFVSLENSSIVNENATLTKTFTTPINAKYIYLSIGNDYASCQLEVNSTATTYEPYQSTTYPINLPSGMELCKIRNYKDYFYKNIPSATDYSSDRELGAWYLKKNIGKALVDGVNKNVVINKDKQYVYQFIVSLFADDNNLYSSEVKTNYFKYKTGDPTDETNEDYVWCYTSQLVVDIRKTITPTLQDFKNWLSNHPVTTYYILKNPTYTKIEGTLASQLNNISYALSKKTQTNISQINNDLPFIIDAQTLLDISNLENRVTLLED